MNAQTLELLKKVLEQPPEVRAAIAGSLIESLDITVDSDAEAAWEAEVSRRIQELGDGSVKPVPWSEARRRIIGQ